MMTAALIAGVGVSGISAATAGAAPGQPDTVAPRAPADAGMQAAESAAVQRGATATVAPMPSAVPSATSSSTIKTPARSSARVQHKVKPKPVVRWVNPLPEATVTSCFGQRWGRLHAGVDLAAANGTPIRAAGAGTVTLAGPEAGYGNAVLIDHGNGFLTHYGHMSKVVATVGQHVKPGEQIGNEGSTGHSTGPHLHFEVHEGSYKNPIEPTAWMHAHGVDIPGCVPLTAK
jgi:murein DD-endopeptidase MepM/ murein hydrolase activator NlpD